jgi:hypothetical protein
MGQAGKQAPDSSPRSGLNEFVRLFRSMVDPYRPELHYMRGPGPKWHAKHRPAAPSYDAVSVAGLVRVKAR